MAYSGSVSIKEIEPIYDSTSNRSEFRFEPNKVYSTNVLLANLGVDNTTAALYNRMAGVGGIFDNVALYDGNVELQMCQDASLWVGWKMSRKSNSSLKDKHNMITGNARGIRYEGQDELANIAAGKIHGKTLRNYDVQTNNQVKSKTGKASIEANQFLPILDALSVLDTRLFKNLRLVVEYNTANSLRASKDEAKTTLRPLLVVEELVNPQQIAAIGPQQSVVFDNIENDRIVIPSRGTTTATVPQLVSTHLNSFNNKKVGKVVMYKQSQSAVNYELNNADLQNGALDSIGCYKETTQVRVNGANVFAKNGVSKPNQRLARLVDAWGDGSLQTFANGVAYKCPDTESREDIIQAGNASVGFMDWFGVDLGYQAIESLQIEFGRTAVFCKTNAGTNDAAQTARSKYNAALNLIMFAMTQKSIVVDGKGGYDIRYL